MLYLWIFLFKIYFSPHTLFQLFLSFLTSIGFAALGYFINEFFDKADDKLAGKANKLETLSNTQSGVLILVILCCTIIPWFGLPTNVQTICLIAFQISLFLFYASPPLRLKNNPVLAPIIDALYAYVSPLLLSAHTFFLISSQTEKPIKLIFFISVLFFIAGYRNIIIHYLNDFEPDNRLDKKTLVKVLGVSTSKTLVKTIAYIEYLLILSLVLVILINGPDYFIFKFSIFIGLVIQLMVQIFSPQKTSKTISELPNTLYQFYFPLLSLILIIWGDTRWAFWFPFHLSLLIPYAKYKPIISWWQRINFRKGYIAIKQVLSWIVNYAIFFSFFLIGVNLRKNKMSAKTYLKTIIKKRLN